MRFIEKKSFADSIRILKINSDSISLLLQLKR